MGCLSVKNKAPPKSASKAPSPKSSQGPSPKAPALPLFTLQAGKEHLCAVLTSTGLALTVSAHLQTLQDWKAVTSQVALLPERFFYCLPNCKVAFVSVDVTSEDCPQLECKQLTEGSSISLASGPILPVLQATHQRIYYDSGPSVLPGTPIYSEAKLVGLHEQPGRGINLVWIFRELLAQGMSLPEDLSRLLKTVQGESAVTLSTPQSRLYNVQRGTLISYSPETEEFLDHVSGLPAQVQFCSIPAGLFLCGGRVEGKIVASVLVFDAGVGHLLRDRTSMSRPRTGHCLCYSQGAVYCISGQAETLTAECEHYSPRQDQWHALPSLPVPRVQAGAASWKHLVYVVGGLDAAQAPVQSVLRLQQEAWQTLTPALPQLIRPVLVESTPSCLYIFCQALLRWEPGSEEARLLVKADFEAGSMRVHDNVLYVFSAQCVQEAKLEADPVVWLLHKNAIPNFV